MTFFQKWKPLETPHKATPAKWARSPAIKISQQFAEEIQYLLSQEHDPLETLDGFYAIKTDLGLGDIPKQGDVIEFVYKISIEYKTLSNLRKKIHIAILKYVNTQVQVLANLLAFEKIEWIDSKKLSNPANAWRIANTLNTILNQQFTGFSTPIAISVRKDLSHFVENYSPLFENQDFLKQLCNSLNEPQRVALKTFLTQNAAFGASVQFETYELSQREYSLPERMEEMEAIV